MALCLSIGTAGLWRLDGRWVVTDVLMCRSGFIFNGQLVQEGCTWTVWSWRWRYCDCRKAGTSYSETQRHILTSVHCSGQVWSAHTVDNCYVKSHCCCTATSVTVSTDVRTQMSVPGEIVSERLQKEICCLLEKCVSAVQCDVCFMLWLYWVSAGGLYSMLCVTGM